MEIASPSPCLAARPPARIDPRAHVGLVYRVASRLAEQLPDRRGALGVEDLVQEGMIGLLGACEAFDPTRGVPFASYACIRITGAILDAADRWARHAVPTRPPSLLADTIDELAARDADAR